MKPGSAVSTHHGRHTVLLVLVSENALYHDFLLEDLWVIYWDVQLHISLCLIPKIMSSELTFSTWNFDLVQECWC